MSKAIIGAVEIGAAFAATAWVGGIGGLAALAAQGGALAAYSSATLALAVSGVSMEAGAIASSIGSEQGIGISTRQAAGLRQIVYGQQRIGGTMIYQSTTGAGGIGGTYVWNSVIVLASHTIDSIVNLYLDGRQVFWKQTANPDSYRANVGCGTVSTPPTATATISGGVITAISASGGSGFANVKPVDGYRVKITGGGGSGATAWAENSGTVGSPVWTVTVTNGGLGYTSQPNIDIQGAYTFGGTGAADEQDSTQPGYGLGYGIGPGGPHYNFSGKVYCEVRFGDQLPSDFMESLSANDTLWAASTAAGTATGTAIINPLNHQVVAVVPTSRGNYTGTPTVSFSGGGGGGASAHCIMDGNQVASVVIDSGGSAYTSAPTVTFIGGSSASSLNTPYVGGCAYIYLNVGADASLFPSMPEVKLTINGKDTIFDPRTSKTGFTSNWALQVADVITDPVFGLGDNTVNQTQLIAAANVCDELIATSQGSEPQYTQNIHYDTSTSPGDALSMMMPSAEGRVSRIGGEWYIWPAYWQGPSFTMDQSSIVANNFKWTPYRSFKDLINCVNGTYVAPNYPYAVEGNLYDKNGFYYGVTNNLWPFAWQPTNFPQYAVDPLHGYGSTVFLNDDGGVVLPTELTLKGVISITQAQRVAKIMLMRNRFQGTGTFEMNLAAWQMQPLDVLQMNFPLMNWTNHLLEVDKIQLKVAPSQGDNGEEGPQAITCVVSFNETDPSIYEWSPAEELTPYDVQALPSSIPTTPAAPTGLTLTDDANTATVFSTGSSISRVLATWTPPADVYVNIGGTIQVQYQFYDTTGTIGPLRPVGTTPLVISGVNYYPTNWVDAGSVSGDATYMYFDNPQGYTNIAVQIRSVRSNGAVSAWVQDSSLIAGTPHLINRPIPYLTKQTALVTGLTANPTISTTGFADLPELGTANAAMTTTLHGNPTNVQSLLTFNASASGGSTGAVTALGVSISSSVVSSHGPPGVTISISGDGTGAGASVSWTQSGSFPFTYTPAVILTGGSGYTHATTTVVISNASSPYSNGTNTYSCTISTGTPVANAVVQAQIVMDGVPIVGPFQVTTDATGTASFNLSQLFYPTAGSHTFNVQAQSLTGSNTVKSTNRSFQLIELA